MGVEGFAERLFIPAVLLRLENVPGNQVIVVGCRPDKLQRLEVRLAILEMHRRAIGHHLAQRHILIVVANALCIDGCIHHRLVTELHVLCGEGLSVLPRDALANQELKRCVDFREGARFCFASDLVVPSVQRRHCDRFLLRRLVGIEPLVHLHRVVEHGQLPLHGRAAKVIFQRHGIPRLVHLCKIAKCVGDAPRVRHESHRLVIMGNDAPLDGRAVLLLDDIRFLPAPGDAGIELQRLRIALHQRIGKVVDDQHLFLTAHQQAIEVLVGRGRADAKLSAALRRRFPPVRVSDIGVKGVFDDLGKVFRGGIVPLHGLGGLRPGDHRGQTKRNPNETTNHHAQEVAVFQGADFPFADAN